LLYQLSYAGESKEEGGKMKDEFSPAYAMDTSSRYFEK
jgi:hypothetical protein